MIVINMKKKNLTLKIDFTVISKTLKVDCFLAFNHHIKIII